MKRKQHNDWNPRDAAIQENQQRKYDEMRERCPVAHSEFMGWSIFRHEDIVNVLVNPEIYSNSSRFLAIPNGMDPPLHGLYREALATNFDQEQMACLESSFRKIAANLLTPTHIGGETEFVNAFTKPFASKALCVFLGWPEEQWEYLSGWIHDNQQAAYNMDQATAAKLATVFSEHVKTNLDRHRVSASNMTDVTDRLLGTNINGKQLSDDKIVSVLRNWVAGHGTVEAGLGILIFHLAHEPELQDRLRNNPSLIPAAIEELLRVDGPLVANRRTTTQEVEIQGRTIPKGEHLTLMWIAANRDPRTFNDPHSIDIERNMDSNLVWGQGIHLCLGAPLARLEMRVALEELLSQTKFIGIIEGAQRRTTYPSNGFAKLMLRTA